MSPAILIVGATGNTGRSVVETLSTFIQSGKALSGHKLIALTRSRESPAAQELTKLPGVEVLEQRWLDITPEWFREHNVVRAFIAPHNEPTQFAEESTFHLAALQGGVKYVVRISTTHANVRPDCAAYYPRQHWAIEALLSSPEFKDLQWSSLQPNVFTSFYLGNAAEHIKQFRKTGKQDTLKLMAAKDAPVGIVHAPDVGIFAAHLLASEDTSVHNGAKYVVNGPEDVTGEQIVKMIESYIGVPVENVVYKDMSAIEQWANASGKTDTLVMSITHAAETAWEGKCTTATTSKEALQIAAPKSTAAEVLKSLLEG